MLMKKTACTVIYYHAQDASCFLRRMCALSSAWRIYEMIEMSMYLDVMCYTVIRFATLIGQITEIILVNSPWEFLLSCLSVLMYIKKWMRI